MFRKGHWGIACLVYAPIASWLLATNQPVVAVVGFLGLIIIEPLPDKDKKIQGLSHRGVSHSLFAAFLVAIGCGLTMWLLVEWGGPLLIAGAQSILANEQAILFHPFAAPTVEVVDNLNARTLAYQAAIVGGGSIIVHLLGDIITYSGIRPFLPFSNRTIAVTTIYSDNRIVNQGLFLLGVGAMLVFVGGQLIPLGEMFPVPFP